MQSSPNSVSVVRLRTFTPWLMTVALSFTLSCRTDSPSVPAVDTPPCAVTKPNGNPPPGLPPTAPFHGGNGLWTTLDWPDGVVVFRPGGPGFIHKSGELEMKFPWWRAVKGRLTIEGRRLDKPAPPLQADIPEGYGDTGFQATALLFPTPGCWEVTGRAGNASLTFVVMVVKAEARQ